MNVQIIDSVECLVQLLAAAGTELADRPGGEAVDPLAHGLQCADILAARYPFDDELAVAGLVHDLGHYPDPDDVAEHGVRGARMIRDLLGARVATLVELHVPAKRYLVTVRPAYAGVLSDVSVRTLAAQGSALSAEEVAAFRSHPQSAAAIALREADDEAKEPGRVVRPLSHWFPVLDRVARSV